MRDMFDKVRYFFGKLWTLELTVVFLSISCFEKQESKTLRKKFSRMDFSVKLLQY